MQHQRVAVSKLLTKKVGALYQDMGTGKTRVALELAVQRLQAGKVDCILWLCPVSVKRTIVAEVDKHLNGATWELVEPRGIRNMDATVYIAGIESLSGSLRLNLRLLDLVQARRCFLVCDESNLIKNDRADRTLSAQRLGERCTYKLILNGTPLSNGVQDMFSQWYFLDRRILGYTSWYSFAANHLEFDPDHPGRIVRAHKVDYLTNKIAPYTYQVRKEECLDLPAKTYGVVECHMTSAQREAYEEIKTVIFDAWENGIDQWDSSIAIFRLFGALQMAVSGRIPKGEPIFPSPRHNPRIQVLLEQLQLLSGKVVIWCKYRHEIADITRVLREDYGADMITEVWGGLSERKRALELERFAGPARFLVANKDCAGYGLNLQFCSYAIYYDNNFSWATRVQSEDRLHRVGQTRNVHIIDIVCRHSIDARIHECLQRKENLIDSFRMEIAQNKDRIRVGRWLDVEDISGHERLRRCS